jgi:hypothetical protein
MGTVDPGLQLHSGQRVLTARQIAEAERFGATYASVQLSTELVDEAAAEALLARAYAAAGLAPPHHTHWLDGPLELVSVLAQHEQWFWVPEVYYERVPHCVWDDSRLEADQIALLGGLGEESVDRRIRRTPRDVKEHLRKAGDYPLVFDVFSHVGLRVWGPVRETVGEAIWRAVADATGRSLSPWIRSSIWGALEYSLWHSIAAYDDAEAMADVLFFDAYLAPNDARALAQFNQLVSGYWLGRGVALVVRRPRLLAFDEAGRLHSATGPGVEYRDEWGVYMWHGVRVPERVIRAPDELTRDDFLGETNMEARRVIQERMGGRFIEELGGRFIDGGDRGVLYEVDLPDDPDEVARYVQVLDASSQREYYLRVPPTVATVDAAVAWTFGLAPGEYRPVRES